ncbi:MAG: hypothetical protein ACYTBV_11420 [Planctomycetota bacterium]
MANKSYIWLFVLIGCCMLCAGCSLNESAGLNGSPGHKATIFFREDWKEIPAQLPITKEHVQNPDLVLSLHGPAGNLIKKSHHNVDPYYVWSGQCDRKWALSLRKNNALVDLSSNGRIRWRTKQFGPNVLKVILEQDNGLWLVSSKGFGETPNWQIFEVELDTLQWHRLDIRTIDSGELVKDPDLHRIRSIGWTDLSTGGGSNACTRVDWIEVYGKEIDAYN